MTRPTKVCANPACHVEFGPGSRGMRDWTSRKYCGASCSRAAQARGGAARRTHCRKQLHELTEDNVYRDSRGNRRCKACTDLADQVRAEKARAGRPKRAHRPKPAPAPVLQVVQSDRPVWRPDGFPPVPNVRGRAS